MYIHCWWISILQCIIQVWIGELSPSQSQSDSLFIPNDCWLNPIDSLVGGLEHFLFFRIQYWEFHYPNCLVVWNIFYFSIYSIGNFIIPTDELIFFRGVGIPPATDSSISIWSFRKSWGGTPKNPPFSWGTPIDGTPYVYSHYWVLNPSKSVNVINAHRMVLPSYKLVYRPIYIYICIIHYCYYSYKL